MTFALLLLLTGSCAALHCSVVILGGSTAALAAAITAAKENESLSVCLSEVRIKAVELMLQPTDWLGGQLTSSAVPAIDFGPHDIQPDNQNVDFAEMMASIPGNPGHCWVSNKCPALPFCVDWK